MNKKVSFGARVKESIRKFIVTLKHKPHYIPLVMLVITFLYFSLNLTHISDTTAKIQGAHMGLCGFATMLFSILSLVCFGNAFPHRKPVNKPMFVLMFVLFGIILFADTMYMNTVLTAITRADNPIAVTESTAYIALAYNMLSTHRILLGISILLIILLPVYSKLIRKIKTNIEVDEVQDMAAIDISGED